MKLQSLSEFALNNNEMDATKGGKRAVTAPAPRTTPAMAALLKTAVGTGGTLKTGTGVCLTGTNCAATHTTMVGKDICIEWKTPSN